MNKLYVNTSFASNIRFMTFRIGAALVFLRYLGNHKPQRFDFHIECKPMGFVNFILLRKNRESLLGN